MTDSDPPHPATWLVKGGRPADIGDPLNAPITLASTYTLGADRAYSRDEGTPTWHAFEDLVGGLETATAVAFASGMAAVAAVFELLPADATIIWPDDCYQGVAAIIADGEQSGRWTSQRLTIDDTDAWCGAAASADLIWVESPSNPLLTVADLARIGAAERPASSLLVVDNTLIGPLAQQPLDLGADLSLQSATKHLGGHSDLLCGVICGRDDALVERLRRHRTLHGATPGALETFLATRGARTMALRLAAAETSATELAARLESHPVVERVRYPGLASHPTHAIAAGQLGGFGTVISFDVAGGAEAADAVCAALTMIGHATSFGGVESTIERRAAVGGQEHLPKGLLRLSVGIEHLDDLWSDLDRALDQATSQP